MSRPALPPRRSATDDEYKPMGIAARIASMQLDHIGRTTPPVKTSKPEAPAIPPRRAVPAAPKSSQAPTPSDEELWARGNEFIRLIGRPPPPIPSKKVDSAPAPPARRLPPMPTRFPTPPPEPEEETSDEGYYSQDSESCLKCHDFSLVDEHAAQFPRESVGSLDQLAHVLTAPWESETEKFRAIFTWMHYNITYDCESFFSGNIQPSTPDSVLRSGLAVCDGYAGLFTGLCERVSLHAQKISGHGKGVGYVAVGPDAPVPPVSSNHAWNCIYMDGQWHLIDSCWGGGALMDGVFNRRFAPIWFVSTPREFGRQHYPTDSSYQLIAPEDGGPIAWEDYILEPEGPTIFQDFYKMNFDPYIVQPAEKYIQSGQWVYFHIFKLCEHISTAQQDNWVYFINLPDGNRTPLEVNEDGGWGANVYIPRGGGDVSLYYVTSFDNRDAKGLAVDTFKKGIGRKAMAFGGMAQWTAV